MDTPVVRDAFEFCCGEALCKRVFPAALPAGAAPWPVRCPGCGVWLYPREALSQTPERELRPERAALMVVREGRVEPCSNAVMLSLAGRGASTAPVPGPHAATVPAVSADGDLLSDVLSATEAHRATSDVRCPKCGAANAPARSARCVRCRETLPDDGAVGEARTVAVPAATATEAPPPRGTRWFVQRKGGGERGPYEPADLERSLRDGLLAPDALVRPEHAKDAWRTLREVAPELAPPSAPRAPTAVTRVVSDEARERANSDRFVGGFVVAIGVALSVISYLSATSGGNGGRYIVTVGPILWGLHRMNRSRADRG